MTENQGHNNPEKHLLKGKVEITEPVRGNLELSVDAQSARESSNKDRQNALDLNKNKHSGSAGGHGASVEVVIRDHHGKEKVGASGKIGGSEKDIEKFEAKGKSISQEELQKNAVRGDFGAAKFLERLLHAKTQEEKQAIQKEADKWFGRGEFAHQDKQGEPVDKNKTNENGKPKDTEKTVSAPEQPVNTGILNAIKADKNIPEEKRELAKQLQEMRSESKKRGRGTEAIDSFAESELQKEIASKQTATKPDDLTNQILRAVIKKEIDDLKTEVGIAHGTVNFVVNTLAGVGNAVRMASAAQFQTTPIGMLCPDLYPDKQATEMLHKTLETTATSARILTQLNTTFNPMSPLFGVEFDPQGAEITRALAKKLPEQVFKEVGRLAHADKEEQAAVATEAILNIVTLVESGGVGAAAKVGEVGQLSKLVKVSEETSALRELTSVAKVANSGEKISPASTAANAFARSMEQQASVISALADLKPSLKPLAEKFRECLTNINEASKTEYAVAGGGKMKAGDGVIDAIENAGQKAKSAIDESGKKIEDYVNRMVGKKGGKDNPNFDKPAGDGSPEEPRKSDNTGNGRKDHDKFEKSDKDAKLTDPELTEHLLKLGRAEECAVEGGFKRLRRTDLGEPRSPYCWDAINERFSRAAVRQSEELSCVSAAGEMLSEGNLSEAYLKEKIGVPGSYSKLIKELGPGWKGDLCEPGEELQQIEEHCKHGPFLAEFFENAYRRSHHVVVVDGITSAGNLLIRDSYEGTRYEMTMKEFLRVWNGKSVFKTVEK